MTLQALSKGGKVPLDLGANNFQNLPELEDLETRKQLELVIKMNNTFGWHISNYLHSRDPVSLEYIILHNNSILNEMDKSVLMMQKTSEKNSFYIGIFLLVILLTIFTVIFLALLKKKRDLQKSIKQLENILPICSYCKKIRLENKNPRDISSWMSIEEHVSKNENVGLSHGICPECLEKNFPDYKI